MKEVLRRLAEFQGTTAMVQALVPQGTSHQHPQLKRSWDSERAEWEPRLQRSDPGSQRPSPPTGPSSLVKLLKDHKFSLSAKAVEPAERAGGRILGWQA